MKERTDDRAEYLDLPIKEIGLRYSNLRMINPKSDAAMVRSFRQYGQITPVIVGHAEGGRYEVVDGFKRLRAGIELGYQSLKAKVLNVGKHALKAAIIHLNIKARTIADVEKGLVIRSLHREDGLSQVEIAVLLGRHKSWVCRRLSLVERLCDGVMDHLKLGLINTTTARELARLPGGNQPDALQSIIKHRFTTDETTKLVSMLLKEPRWNHEAILRFPEPILDARHPDRQNRPDTTDMVCGILMKIELLLASKEFCNQDFTKLTKEDQGRILFIVERIEKSLRTPCRIISETVKS